MYYLFKKMFFSIKNQTMLLILAFLMMANYDITWKNYILLYIANFCIFYGSFYTLFNIVNPKEIGR